VLQEDNILIVSVDNSENNRVYPQLADFTFYGGIYRDVNMVIVPQTHFSLDRSGGTGVQVTPVVEGDRAVVTIDVWVTGEDTDIALAVGRDREKREKR
jgi:beta-galactosidase